MPRKTKKKSPKVLVDPKDELLGRINHFREAPVDYLGDVLGIKRIWRKPGDLDAYPGEPAIWKLQEQILLSCPRAIKERKAIYIASGHSLGKDYIAGAIALWFLQTYIPSLVVETGPTSRQVEDIMWKETQGHWGRKLINLGGKAFNQPRLEIDKDWYLVGFTTKESKGSAEAGGSKFQGFKGKDNVCVIVTEAQAVEEMIYDQIDAITTGANILIIFLGNPTRAKGRFAKGLKDPLNNIVFNVSCLENPNYIEQKSVIPGLASYAWVEDKRIKWGEDDPRWIGRVLGKVPEGAMNNVFNDAIFNQMMARHGLIGQYSDNRGVSLDPAGEGVDENVFKSGSGGEIFETFKKTQMSPSDTAVKAVEMCKRINGNFVIVDTDGLGQRDYAELKKLPADYLQGIQIIGFHGSAPSSVKLMMPDGSERPVYGNLRCEASFVTQARGKAGKAALDPKDKELKEDLETDEYFEKKGVLWLTDKSDVRESLGRSPGDGDAYKMLQWAFSKDFKSQTFYQSARNRLPAYGITDSISPDPNIRNLPTHGVDD